MDAVATRQAFGDGVIELVERYKNLYVIDSDISRSMKTDRFAKLYPDNHINTGIAEQNAAGIAAGLASMGKIPIISTYAVFGSMRMVEQIRTSICYPNFHAIIACSHGGLTPGNDGVTHQAIEDMGILRTLPGMKVIMGADYYSTRKLLEKAVEGEGPIYIRFTRDAMPIIYCEDDEFEIGKGKVLKEGEDISIIAIGDMVHQALKASEILEKRGILCDVIDMHTLKPLDIDLVNKCIEKNQKIITVEDHNIFNGLGSAVAEVIAEKGKGVLRRVGLKDRFAESGNYHELLSKYEMDSKKIVDVALDLAGKNSI